jgi:hypothetical protein
MLLWSGQRHPLRADTEKEVASRAGRPICRGILRLARGFGVVHLRLRPRAPPTSALPCRSGAFDHSSIDTPSISGPGTLILPPMCAGCDLPIGRCTLLTHPTGSGSMAWSKPWSKSRNLEREPCSRIPDRRSDAWRALRGTDAWPHKMALEFARRDAVEQLGIKALGIGAPAVVA